MILNHDLCQPWEDKIKELSDENTELKKALQWALGTCDNAADIIGDDEEDETEEVKEMIKGYRKQFNLSKKFNRGGTDVH
jgi:hypothetical protein